MSADLRSLWDVEADAQLVAMVAHEDEQDALWELYGDCAITGNTRIPLPTEPTEEEAGLMSAAEKEAS